MRLRQGTAIATVLSAVALAWPAGASAGGPPEEYVSFRSPGPGPSQLDRVWVNKIGPANPDRVLVLMPGTAGGAGDFTLAGRELVDRIPGLAVWAIDRRSQPLEDTSVFEELQAGDATLQEAFDYYLGWIVNGGTPADHFDFINPDDHGYARRWGMRTALNDARVVVNRARAGGRRDVWLGGHSLGASLSAAYAAWDFGGRPGYRGLAGIVLIDGGLLGSFDAFTLAEAQQQIEDLEQQTADKPFLLFVGSTASISAAVIPRTSRRVRPLATTALAIPEAAGQPVTGENQLRQALRRMKPGGERTLKGVRGNIQKTWQVTVGELPAANEFGG